MVKKKEKLMEIQKQLIELQHLLITIEEEKRKRDQLFRSIVDSLGKVMRKDYSKQYDEWVEDVFADRGIVNTEDSMEWLKSIFQQAVDKLK